MTVGKQIGTFEMKSTSVSLIHNKGDVLTTKLNLEGRVSGEVESEALATMTIESADGKDGTYTVCARYFMPDGSIMDAWGEGETISQEGHNWRVAGIADRSNGDHIAVQGLIDLAKRSFEGRIFERT